MLFIYSRPGGTPEMIRLKRIGLKSGQSIEVADGLTVIVGPNNVGKSRILSELYQDFHVSPQHQRDPLHLVVESSDVERTGSLEEFLERFFATYRRREPGRYSDGQFGEANYRSSSGVILESQIRMAWDSDERLGALGPLYVRYLGADGRTSAVGDASMYNQLTDIPQGPIQSLYADRDLEARFSELMFRAFNEHLTVNRYAGGQISLHVGRVTAPETPPPGSRDYLDEIARLPLLREQGDGMRAFMGILLTIATAFYPIVMIDEPEAFLHPPQAYLLGQMLAELPAGGVQAIVATHSSDVLEGVTAAGSPSGGVTVARLTRQGNENHVAQIPVGIVGNLYRDPLVKYYGILDGLFYHGTVICEADSDCTYYRAVLEALGTLDDGTPVSAISLHFAHCGGKDRIPLAVGALRSAKVPVVCIVDFDFLRDEKNFKELVDACGGDPSMLRSLRNDVASAIDSRATKVERAVAKVKIDEVLSGGRSAELTVGELDRIKKVISARSGWAVAKTTGRALLSGQSVDSFNRLNAALRDIGIFVVEAGELERFHPEVPADNKAAWLRKVLEERKFAESTDAATFLRAIASAVRQRQ